MVRASSSKKRKEEDLNGEPNPEVTERKRLKKLAFSKNMVSETPSRPFSALSPSKTVTKHHGKDIIKKSHRKNKFLFSFPGLLAPIEGGKIGELKDLGTKNPVLYIDFPQGQMKLFGTIVYLRNRYLTLQFSRGGKNVMCEDYFDNMIVFSDAWWIGRKEENPEEARLDFPKELKEGQCIEYNFKGGAGAESVSKQGVHKSGMKHVEEQSPEAEFEGDLSNGEKDMKILMETTPVRQSKRTSGKTFNFAEVSSGDDSVRSDADITEGEEKKNGMEIDSLNGNHTVGKTNNNSCPVIIAIDNEDAAASNHFPEQFQVPSESVTKSKRPSGSAVAATKSKDDSRSDHCSLVQATISTLFKKVEEKKTPRSSRKSPSSKDSGKKWQRTDLKRKIDQAEGPKKKGKVVEEKKTGSGSKGKKKEYEVEDEIEEFSSASRDTSGSDEDWAA